MRDPVEVWRRVRIWLAFTAVMLVGCRGCGPSEPPSTFLLGGIQINEPVHEEWVEALQRHGMNTVSVTVYAKQGDWDSPHLWWSAQEPAVVSEIETAKAAGLKVVLILRIALDHAFERNRFMWHGMIHPMGPEALDAWFERYETFVLLWADRAQALGVDVLGVGSELSSLTSTRPVEAIPQLHRYYLDAEAQGRAHNELLKYGDRIEPRHWAALGGAEYDTLVGFLQMRSAVWRDWAARTLGAGDDAVRLRRHNARRAHIDARWRALIKKVRAVFQGRLTYAANFDQYGEVGFWDALDIMGINAYFQLRDANRVSKPDDRLQDELREGWLKVFKQIEATRQAQALGAMPVVFTELGYTQAKDGSYEPWAMQGLSVLGPVDDRQLYIWQDQPRVADERAAAVRALHEVHQAQPGLLQGLLYWKLTTKTYHREIEAFGLLLAKPSDDPLLEALTRFSR